MKIAMIGLAALMAVSSAANAASFSIQTLNFTGDVVDFNNFDGYLLPENGNSLNLGSNITLSTNGSVTVGQNAFNLEENGLWTSIGNQNRDGNFLSATTSQTLSFNFGAGIQNVGIFLNHYRALNESNTIQIHAYDISGNQLETNSLGINTASDSYDEGTFVGFNRASADVYSFRITGANFVADNLTVSAVPEPESYAMFLAGLGLMGFATGRRQV